MTIIPTDIGQTTYMAESSTQCNFEEPPSDDDDILMHESL